MHNVGASRTAEHRIKLTPDTYGIANLKHLIDTNTIPKHLEDSYKQTVEAICKISEPRFAKTAVHRIHGDCHLGNLLYGRDGLFFVDFDDMVTGPAVQDVWLVIPSRDDFAKRQIETMVDAYQTMRPFDRSSLSLIEPLRALRFVHFSAWISRRWQDPAFPKAFPQFGTERYWQEQIQDLKEQLSFCYE